MTKARIGNKRWVRETIDTAAVEALARKYGWDGNEKDSLFDYCEPSDAQIDCVHKSLDEAIEAARRYLELGTSFFGCVMIDEEVFDTPSDDEGNLIDIPPCWETVNTYEVDATGDVIKLSNY